MNGIRVNLKYLSLVQKKVQITTESVSTLIIATEKVLQIMCHSFRTRISTSTSKAMRVLVVFLMEEIFLCEIVLQIINY